jgi:hypothetical protein
VKAIQKSRLFVQTAGENLPLWERSTQGKNSSQVTTQPDRLIAKNQHKPLYDNEWL